MATLPTLLHLTAAERTSDNTYTSTPAGFSGTQTPTTTSFDATPSDFSNMDTLSFTVELHAVQTDDSMGYGFSVTAGDGTVLAAANAAGDPVTVVALTSAPPKTDTVYTIAFPYVNTAATKAQWDDARGRRHISLTTAMANDNAYWNLDYVALVNGTYTAVVAGTYTGTAASTLSPVSQSATDSKQHPYETEVRSDSPVAYWRLEETSGTVGADEIGTNDLTWYNTPTLGVAAKVGKGADLRASTGYGDTPNVAPSGAAERTYELWFYPTDAGANVPIWHHGVDGTNGTRLVFVAKTGTGLLNFSWWGGNADHGTVTWDTWHHLAVVVPAGATSSSDVIVYLDGELRAGTLVGGAHQTLNTTANRWRIGANGPEPPTSTGAMMADEAAVYSTALTQARIQAHIDAAQPAPSTYTGSAVSDLPSLTQSAEVIDDRSFYRDITVDNTGGALKENWPVKVTLTSTNFDFTKVRTDGKDLVFKTSAGVYLAHWIESFDSAGQTATLWVRVPSIPAAGSATVQLHYDSAAKNFKDSDPAKTFPVGVDFSDVTQFMDSAVSPASKVSLFNPMEIVNRSEITDATHVREQDQIVYDPGDADANRRWKWYFSVTVNTAGTAYKRIFVKFSADGVTWSAPTKCVMGANDRTSEDPTITTKWSVADRGHVYRDVNNTMYLYVEDTVSGGTYVYSTTDNVNFTEMASNPAIPKGAAGTFDEGLTGSPCAVHDGTNFIVAYEGINGGSTSEALGIAYGTTANGLTKSANNPVWRPASEPLAADSIVVDTMFLDDDGTTVWLYAHTGKSTQAGIWRGKTTVTNPINWVSGDIVGHGESVEYAATDITVNHAVAGLQGMLFGKGVTESIHRMSINSSDLEWHFRRVLDPDYTGIQQHDSLETLNPIVSPARVENGTLSLATADDSNSVAATDEWSLTMWRAEQMPGSDFEILWRASQTLNYAGIAIGEGALGVARDAAIAQGHQAAVATGYQMRVSPVTGGLDVRRVDGTYETTSLATATPASTDTSTVQTRSLIFRGNGAITAKVGGVTASATDAAPLTGAKSLTVWQGKTATDDASASLTVEYLVVRPYDGVDATTTVGAEQGNQAPVASFTATPNPMLSIMDTVSLDGTSSSDPDGDVLTYQWELVSAPPGYTGSFNTPTAATAIFTPSESAFAEDFTGTDGAAWDATRWAALIGGGTTTRAINLNRGQHTMADLAYSTARSKAETAAFSDFDLECTFDNQGYDVSAFIYFHVSEWSATSWQANEGYYAVFSPPFTTSPLKIRRRTTDDAGTTTQVDIATSSQTMPNTGKNRLRIQMIGTAIKVRVWDDGTVEPTTWAIEVSDSTHASGVFALASQNNNQTLQQIQVFDDVRITAL